MKHTRIQFRMKDKEKIMIENDFFESIDEAEIKEKIEEELENIKEEKSEKI